MFGPSSICCRKLLRRTEDFADYGLAVLRYLAETYDSVNDALRNPADFSDFNLWTHTRGCAPIYGKSFYGKSLSMKDDNVKSHEWDILLYVTQFPNVEIYPKLIQRHSISSRNVFESHITSLQNSGLIDAAFFYDHDRIQRGQIPSLYIFNKVHGQQKVLSGQFEDILGNSNGSISPLYTLLELIKECFGLADYTSGIESILNKTSAIRAMMATVDSTLLSTWGNERFSQNIAPLGISLSEWLAIT